jgi:hypothetical protein
MRFRRVEIEDDVVNVEGMSHNCSQDRAAASAL